LAIPELELQLVVEKVQVFEMTGEKAVHEKFFIIPIRHCHTPK
jgi:hypothetical protein